MQKKHIELLKGKSEINAIHISDTHLFKSKDEILKEAANSFERLQLIVNKIKQNNTNFDIIIVTGDISEDGSPESYQLFKEELDRLKKPSLWLPGNHDNFKNMPETIFNEHVLNTAEIGKWKLIFLDTTIPGVDHGKLSKQEIERLKLFLNENHKFPMLICMHHPPIDVGSKFIDLLGLKNKNVFWKTISNNHAPKGILFGHVHQIIDEREDNIRLSSPPSTCLQWIPKSKNFAYNASEFGYQEIKLSKLGSISTRIIKIEND